MDVSLARYREIAQALADAGIQVKELAGYFHWLGHDTADSNLSIEAQSRKGELKRKREELRRELEAVNAELAGAAA